MRLFPHTRGTILFIVTLVAELLKLLIKSTQSPLSELFSIESNLSDIHGGKFFKSSFEILMFECCLFDLTIITSPPLASIICDM